VNLMRGTLKEWLGWVERSTARTVAEHRTFIRFPEDSIAKIEKKSTPQSWEGISDVKDPGRDYVCVVPCHVSTV